MNNDAVLFKKAREESKLLLRPDKKQLKYNEIVETAKLFYYNDIEAGIKELVISCEKPPENIDKNYSSYHSLYVKNRPMWKVLQEEYSWMLR